MYACTQTQDVYIFNNYVFLMTINVATMISATSGGPAYLCCSTDGGVAYICWYISNSNPAVGYIVQITFPGTVTNLTANFGTQIISNK